jgi:hypothetical protein
MKRVVVDVIKQYFVVVDDSINDPVTYVGLMQSTEIEEIGDLHVIETSVVEVESDDVEDECDAGNDDVSEAV